MALSQRHRQRDFCQWPSTVYFLDSDLTIHGMASISAPTHIATQRTFTVTFLPQNELKPATYTDTVTLLLCSDPQCRCSIRRHRAAGDSRLHIADLRGAMRDGSVTHSPVVRSRTNGISLITGVSAGTGYIIVISGAFVGP
jgi:hypothetical protein